MIKIDSMQNRTEYVKDDTKIARLYALLRRWGRKNYVYPTKYYTDALYKWHANEVCNRR